MRAYGVRRNEDYLLKNGAGCRTETHRKLARLMRRRERRKQRQDLATWQ